MDKQALTNYFLLTITKRRKELLEDIQLEGIATKENKLVLKAMYDLERKALKYKMVGFNTINILKDIISSLLFWEQYYRQNEYAEEMYSTLKHWRYWLEVECNE